MRKYLLTLVAVLSLFVLVPSGAAAALETVVSPRNADDDSGYTPDEPDQPTLAGSTVTGNCDGDVPWISFSVSLTDPDKQSTGNTARLVLTDLDNAANTEVIELGELDEGVLNGRVLWPGASVDAGGNPTGWPGWEFVAGEWRETDANYRWTRGSISAVIEVNPEIAVPLSYPKATPDCATQPRELTLEGSTAVSECVQRVTWINYDVRLNDPYNLSTGHDVRLEMTDGENSVVLNLGALDSNNELSGRILWPGSEIDENGRLVPPPGWQPDGRDWMPIDPGFEWTKGDIQAKLTVNPEIAVDLTFPPISSECPAYAVEGNLPVTGLSAAIFPLAGLGLLLALAGGGIVLARRHKKV